MAVTNTLNPTAVPTVIARQGSHFNLNFIRYMLSNPKGGSLDSTPIQIIKTVSGPATPEALAADGTFFRRATLIGKKSARTNNVGIVYLGIGTLNDSQAYEISPNEVIGLSVPEGEKYDLNDWVLDVLTAGDGVVIIYS